MSSLADSSPSRTSTQGEPQPLDPAKALIELRLAATALGRLAAFGFRLTTSPPRALFAPSHRTDQPRPSASGQSPTANGQERPPPPPRPHPSLTPDDLLTLASNTLCNPDPEAIERLQPFLMPVWTGAMPDFARVTAVYDLQNTPGTGYSWTAWSTNLADFGQYTIAVERPDLPPALFSICLEKAETGKRRGCWLIKAIKALDDPARAPPYDSS